jgi:GntR family transcriptional regulator, sialic acid-inducible nan operon repressor
MSARVSRALRPPRGVERRPVRARAPEGPASRRGARLVGRGPVEIPYLDYERELDFEPTLIQFPGMAVSSIRNLRGMEAPIVRRKLSDEIFERLKVMITSGDYGPGEALPSERELMTRYAVGRPAIREAMQALANHGLITIRHGERARVRTFTAKAAVSQINTVAQLMLSASPAMLENLKEARRFFEVGMVREAAIKATDADIVELRQILDQQRGSIDDRTDFVEANTAFHMKIAAISRNAIFEAVSEAMLGWLREYNIDSALWADHGAQTLGEHAEILAFIEKRDPAGAEAALCRHLDRLIE